MKQTPLNERHKALGARMVDYAGWDMPVQYEGIAAETLAVRNNCGIFDVSHMGEILVSGDGAGEFLNWLLSRKVTGKEPDQITYTIMCQSDGGVVDDLLVYTVPEGYLLVVNAANKDKDLVHIGDSVRLFSDRFGVAATEINYDDLSPAYAQVAVQGPRSLDFMLKAGALLGLDDEGVEALTTLKRFRSLNLPAVDEEGPPLIISRTGYTGEDGYEVYGSARLIIALWDFLTIEGCVPCGLGSRDALRLEAGLPLYGHEMSAEINPLDADLDFFVKFDRPFQGDGMVKTRKIVRLVNPGRKIPRDGYPVFHGDDEVGYVTSGGFSPTLGKGIANALVRMEVPADVKELGVTIRGKKIMFDVVENYLEK